MAHTTFTEASDIRSVDRQLLLAMRGGLSHGVGELTETLGVTATAVRQRIERLLELGLIEREKQVAGRGRPTFRYRLTLDGHHLAGANPAELADVMWREILAFPDETVREQLLSAVATRLGQRYAAHLAETQSSVFPADAGACSMNSNDSLEQRIRSLSEMLSTRQIESDLSHEGDLPVLDLGTCPYPSLSDASQGRAMCRLEEKMFSEALGHPVHLSSCRLDGDACCQFAPVGGSTDSGVTHPNLIDGAPVQLDESPQI
jgi:predicted ArsR family transcriptional regulator